MRKNSHFSGQPLYGQVIKLLDKSKFFNSTAKTVVNATSSISTAKVIWW